MKEFTNLNEVCANIKSELFILMNNEYINVRYIGKSTLKRYITRYIKSNIKKSKEEFINILCDITDIMYAKDYTYEEILLVNKHSYILWKRFNNPVKQINKDTYNIAYRQLFGRVAILGETKDLFGNKMFKIQPIDETDIYNIIENDSSLIDFNNVKLNQLRNEMYCYEYELINLDNLKTEIRNAICNNNKTDEYISFSAINWQERSYIRDRNGSSYKKLDAVQSTSPQGSTIEGQLQIIKELPKSKIYGNKYDLYHIELYHTKNRIKRRKAFNNSIEITPKTEKITINGVTSYMADINDNRGELKFKNKQGKWVNRYNTQLVLAINPETRKLIITPAFWLSNINAVPNNIIELEIPVYEKIQNWRKNASLNTILKSYKLIKYKKVKLDLTNNTDREYYNCINKTYCKYKPSNNNIDYNPYLSGENDILEDIITADRVSNNNIKSEEAYKEMQNELFDIYNKKQEKILKLKNAIENELKIQEIKVDWKEMKLFITKGKNYIINLIKNNNKIILENTNMSKKALNILTSYINV